MSPFQYELIDNQHLTPQLAALHRAAQLADNIRNADNMATHWGHLEEHRKEWSELSTQLLNQIAEIHPQLIPKGKPAPEGTGL